MVRIGGDEDDERRLDLHQALNHRKTVEPRHLDVEEDEVGFVGLDLSYRLAAILCGVDDFDITMRFEPQLQALGRQFFIIHQDGSDRHVRSVPIVICPSGWNGNSMTTVNPPSAPRRSEEHTSELQSLMRISYAVFCLKKKKKITTTN